MKEIDIFIRVLQKAPSTIGDAIILFRMGNKTKEIYMSVLGATQNKSIIIASTLAIEGLKEPRRVKLYVQTNFGFKFMENGKRWVNRELGDELAIAIALGGHEVAFFDCSSEDVKNGKHYQNELNKRLKVNDDVRG